MSVLKFVRDIDLGSAFDIGVLEANKVNPKNTAFTKAGSNLVITPVVGAVTTIDLSTIDVTVESTDSASIDFSGDGTAATPLTAIIKPSAIRSLADVEVQNIFGVTQYYAFSTNV